MSRKLLVLLMIGLIVSSVTSMPLFASGDKGASVGDYPTKPIQFIVPWSPGGGSDTLMRIVAKYLEKYLDTPVPIINKPGVSGTLGLKEFSTKPNNGYYISQIHEGLLAAYHTDITDLNYDSFVPVASMTSSPQYLAVRGDAPWDSYEDFITYAREHPNEVTFGVTIKGIPHIWVAILSDVTDTQFKLVSYEGTGQRVQALAGGFIDAAPVDYPSGIQFVESGKLKFLASATAERLEMKPEILTIKELGHDIIWNVTRGIVVPKGTPAEVTDVLEDTLRKIADDEEFIREIETTGGFVEFKGTEEYVNSLKDLNTAIENVSDMLK